MTPRLRNMVLSTALLRQYIIEELARITELLAARRASLRGASAAAQPASDGKGDGKGKGLRASGGGASAALPSTPTPW
jgi:hypothetical protein